MAKSTLCIQRLLLQRRDQIEFPCLRYIDRNTFKFLVFFYALSPNIKVYCCTMDISRAQNKISKKIVKKNISLFYLNSKYITCISPDIKKSFSYVIIKCSGSQRVASEISCLDTYDKVLIFC